jgi:hypothetical protein
MAEILAISGWLLIGLLLIHKGIRQNVVSTKMKEGKDIENIKDINLNSFAKQVAKLEGKKKSQDIAQIKETIRIVLLLLNEHNSKTILKLVRRVK